MSIQENISLAQYTTFQIGGIARYFCIIDIESQVPEAVRFAQEKSLPILVIGGGSNMLISDEGFKGLVIKMEIRSILKKPVAGSSKVLVSCGAGEMWDTLVEYSVNEDLYGL